MGGGVAPHGDKVVIRALKNCIEREGNTTVAEAIGEALGKIAKSDGAAIADFIGVFENEDPNIRRHAANVLAKLAEKGDQPVIKALTHRIEFDDNHTVVEAAGRSLGLVADGDQATMATLIRLLGCNNSMTRRTAADALGNGPIVFRKGISRIRPLKASNNKMCTRLSKIRWRKIYNAHNTMLIIMRQSILILIAAMLIKI